MSAAAARAAYHPDIRNAVVASGDPTLFDEIPTSTQRTWLSRGPANVVTMAPDASHLVLRVQRLEQANRRLRNVVRLLLALTRAFGFTLAGHRIPDAAGKRLLMRAVTRAAEAMPRKHALRVLGLTASRLAAWNSAEVACELDDAPSCPRSRPTRTSARELLAIKAMVCSEALSHMSIRALALLAQRYDVVHLGVGTWYRLVRQRGWSRPRCRIHPRPSRLGLRASRVGQYLHVDITVLRLLDGSVAYVQAIIDNFSRAILAHQVSTTKTAAQTATLIRQARRVLGSRGPAAILVADDGSENSATHPAVAAALHDTATTLCVAQVDLLCSNSMIERFWLSMKGSFLYMQKLVSIAHLQRFVDFYVQQHNDVMPHSAFEGQTPAEVLRGDAARLPALLAAKRADARALRVEENRRMRCDACPPTAPPVTRVP